MIKLGTQVQHKLHDDLNGDGDAYGDAVYENILDKIQNAYVKEENSCHN